jgi:serine/threonine protein phosphatase PrpC
MRVWFPDEEGPGLAMSRAFGDFDAQEIGIVGTPDITLTPRTDQDLCVVVASDGVWQYVSEAEAVELIEQASLQGERAQAAERLVELATQRWFAHESRRDDITALVAFLDQ